MNLLPRLRRSIPTPAICACGPFRSAIETKSPALFRLVPDQIQIISVPSEALSAAEVHVGSGNQSLICTVIEAQCELLRVPDRADELAGCIGAAARVAENALRNGRRLDLADIVGRAGASGAGAAGRRTIVVRA